MYLTVTQQIRHLSDSDCQTIRELCHYAKNLTNEAIYNVRQVFQNEGKILKYADNYALLKNSTNYLQRKINIRFKPAACRAIFPKTAIPL